MHPWILALAAVATAAQPAPAAQPDAQRLALGGFVYSDQQGGREIGHDRITIEKQASGVYRFSNTAIGYADQRWSAVASARFEPISAELVFGAGNAARRAFEIRYAHGRVSGYYLKRGNADEQRVSVDRDVARGTIDQRIDWAAVIASELTPGGRFTFKVYDPVIGTSEATAMAEAGARLRVPAGDFDAIRVTYRIAKASGAGQYVVFTTAKGPRMLLREDFPDGTSTLLTKVTRR